LGHLGLSRDTVTLFIDVVTGITNFCDFFGTDLLSQRSGDAFTPTQVLVSADGLPDRGFPRYT